MISFDDVIRVWNTYFSGPQGCLRCHQPQDRENCFLCTDCLNLVIQLFLQEEPEIHEFQDPSEFPLEEEEMYGGPKEETEIN